jgi:ribosomal protein L37E
MVGKSFFLELTLTLYFGRMNEELAKTDVCRNCGSPDIRIYCAACGQKTIFHRFKLKDSLFLVVCQDF